MVERLLIRFSHQKDVLAERAYVPRDDMAECNAITSGSGDGNGWACVHTFLVRPRDKILKYALKLRSSIHEENR